MELLNRLMMAIEQSKCEFASFDGVPMVKGNLGLESCTGLKALQTAGISTLSILFRPFRSRPEG